MTRPFSIHSVTKGREDGLPTHSHTEGQLTFAASGMVQVVTPQGIWLVPPQLAAWVPPGVRHSLDIVTEAELWLVHVGREQIGDWGFAALLDRAFALRVTPLLHSLLSEAVAIDAGSDKAELVVRLMLHELTAMPDAPTYLPMPESPTGRRLADLALEDRRGAMGLRELASAAATSVRTASRLFPAETGMTLKSWRQRARIVSAMQRLADGDAPAQAAHQAGFASTAAFSHAFRQVTGVTPTVFMAAKPYVDYSTRR